MPRFFNTAGPCRAEEHYMLPAEARTPEARPLIEGGHYFVIHAPRQSGKTTLIRNLARELTAEGKYAAVALSLESMTEDSVELMMPQFLHHLTLTARDQLGASTPVPNRADFVNDPHVALQHFLSAWTALSERPLVLLFDEVDAVPPTLLVSLLRQLRSGYCSRPAPFPHSIALIGMRDVRDYKAQVRQEQQSLGTASPFNIKTRSLSLRSFDFEETRALLLQHTEDTGQRFEDQAIDEIFEQSQGQPWLCNALAAQLVSSFDALMPERSLAVTRQHVLQARELLIERRDTHLDSLVARLREDRVRRVVEPLMTGELSVDPSYDDDWRYVQDLGLVSIRKGQRVIANPIYQEIIPRVLTHQVQTGIPLEPASFVDANGQLRMRRLLEEFLEFWREHGEVLLRGMPYQEAAPHLVLMAYLQRVVNGGGHIHREFAVGTRRADLVVELGGRRDVIEIKLDYGPAALRRGLSQTVAYAKRLGRDQGYLVIFDPKSSTPWDERGQFEEHQQDGVRVLVLRA
ncbi:MAG: ATP-binding protein [Myxococcota bacterium]|jgi:hypothetical protein|nr:ATP-binding protein [Myxococcota bacterium]